MTSRSEIAISADQLLNVFERLYAVAGEASPRQQAEEVVTEIYKDVGTKLAEIKGQSVRYELEAEMVEMAEPEMVLELLLKRFDSQEVKEQIVRSTEEVFGRWVNSTLASLDEQRLLRMRDVVLELGRSLNIDSN